MLDYVESAVGNIGLRVDYGRLKWINSGLCWIKGVLWWIEIDQGGINWIMVDCSGLNRIMADCSELNSITGGLRVDYSRLVGGLKSSECFSIHST